MGTLGSTQKAIGCEGDRPRCPSRTGLRADEIVNRALSWTTAAQTLLGVEFGQLVSERSESAEGPRASSSCLAATIQLRAN